MNIYLLFFLQGMGSFLQGIFPFILVFGVFYFLIIMPHKRRQRELQETISHLKAGDRVVTTGGIIGTVQSVRESSLILRSADKSMIEVARSAVAGLQGEEEKKQ